MPGTKTISFRPEDIVDLLTHYTDGRVPLGAKLLSIGSHATLNRHVGMLMESDQWEGPRFADGMPFLYIDYEGRKVLAWGDRESELEWKEGPKS